MLRLGIAVQPRAMVSTAVAMSRSLRAKLASTFECAVIDWYSLTETGPIGYLCPLQRDRGRAEPPDPARAGPQTRPESEAYHVLPHDIHVEALRPDGRCAGPDEPGEIAVTGGRNPYLPLLRYRTGDFGRIDRAPCPCGDPMPRLLDLEGRAPVLFRAKDGSPVNTVDLSRILREFPFIQHALVQRKDGTCELTVRPAFGMRFDKEEIARALSTALGAVPIAVIRDDALGDRRPEGGGKIVPYRSEHLLED